MSSRSATAGTTSAGMTGGTPRLRSPRRRAERNVGRPLVLARAQRVEHDADDGAGEDEARPREERSGSSAYRPHVGLDRIGKRRQRSTSSARVASAASGERRRGTRGEPAGSVRAAPHSAAAAMIDGPMMLRMSTRSSVAATTSRGPTPEAGRETRARRSRGRGERPRVRHRRPSRSSASSIPPTAARRRRRETGTAARRSRRGSSPARTRGSGDRGRASSCRGGAPRS